MKRYDIIVIGSGAGSNISSVARMKGKKVALVENGPLGGTCLNRGCIPSKIWTHAADVIRRTDDAERIGVKANVEYVDFGLVQERLWNLVRGDSTAMERGLKSDRGIDLIQDTAEFVKDKTIRAGGRNMTAETIVIANGCRTLVPDIPGLEGVGYLTSEDVFGIDDLPDSLMVIGGGYKAAEFAHFFSAMGTEVHIVGRNPRLLPREEPEVSDIMRSRMSRFMYLHLGYVPESFHSHDGMKHCVIRDVSTGATKDLSVDEVLICAGVRSNNDLLHPENAGVETDGKGFIRVDGHLETNVKGIYALGDTLGRTMFRHTANYQSMVVWENISGKDVSLDERVVPHAVYTYPQVSSVGLTEREAKDAGLFVSVGRASYGDTAKGYAMDETDSMVKVVVENGSGRILGASICGSDADILIQGIVYMMNSEKGAYWPLYRSQVIHPSLAEVVDRAFHNLAHVHDH